MTYQLTSRAKFWLFLLSALALSPLYANLINELFPDGVRRFPYGVLKGLSLFYAALASAGAIEYGILLKKPWLLAAGGWFLGLFATGRALAFYGESEAYLGTLLLLFGLGVLIFVGNRVFPFRLPPAVQ
jgi:hypothetical protein